MKVKYYTNIMDNLHFLIFDTFNKAYKWELAPVDIKVLSEFYNVDYILIQKIPTYKERMTVLFSSGVKEAIYKKLGLSYNTFNNSLSKLRKRGMINKNELIEKYLLDLGKEEFNITLNVINERGDREVTAEAQQTV